jgi:ABC-type multidrug transport system ATPase subunit
MVDSVANSTGRGDVSQFVKIDRLSKHFDEVAAVDNVSLNIEKGEIFALLGSSGCGKSTLLRMLAGFELPTSGNMYLDGEDISNMPPYERPINMMFQSYALFPHLTVWENVAFGLKRDGMPKDSNPMPSASHINFPAVSSNVSLWRAVWQRVRSCCCSTNRLGHWIESCVRKPSSNWSISSRMWGSPASW